MRAGVDRTVECYVAEQRRSKQASATQLPCVSQLPGEYLKNAHTRARCQLPLPAVASRAASVLAIVAPPLASVSPNSTG